MNKNFLVNKLLKTASKGEQKAPSKIAKLEKKKESCWELKLAVSFAVESLLLP